MIKVLHGDEIYLLPVIVLPAQRGLDLYLLSAAAVISLIILVIIRYRLSSKKPSYQLQKTAFSIVLLLAVSTVAIIPAYGEPRTVNVKVEDDIGNSIEGANVSLFDSGYNYLFSLRTDSEGVASFMNLEEGDYIYEIYFQESDLKGEFWGSGTLTVDNDLTEVLFKRTTPRVVSVETQDIDENDKMNIVVEMLTPGPSEAKVMVNLLLDRDQVQPYDMTKKSKSITIASNSIEAYEFKVELKEPGAYYLSVYLSVSGSKNIVTDQTPWSSAADISGSIAIQAKNAGGKTQTFFVLFNSTYIFLEYKSADGSKKVQWDDLAPLNYIVEIYHRPATSLDLIEFWGAFTAQVSKKTLKFEQVSPTIDEVRSKKDGGSKMVIVTVKNKESYAKQIKVSLIIDSDKEAPFDGFQETEVTVLDSNGEMAFTFAIDGDTFPKGQVYIFVQSVYNNNYLVTDQQDWFKLK